MFIIKNSQLEAFRIPIRKKSREKLFTELQSKGFKKIDESPTSVLVEDEKGRKSSFGYSEKNLLSRLIKPTGVEYIFSYDEEDRLNKIGLPNKETLKLKFKDNLPNNIQINNAGLDIIYNAKSQVSEIVFPDKKSVRFQYNENDKLISVINRANETQSFNSTIKDNKLVHQLTDSLGRQIVLVMNANGGIEKVIYPDGTTQEVSYDENLDAEVVKLRNGKTKTIFNGEFYPERIEWEDGEFQDITFNELQQIVSVQNTSGTISYECNDQGRPLSESFQVSKVGYVYENDLLKSIIYPSGLHVSYDYNQDDQLKAVKIGEKVITYKYDSSGLLAQIVYPNGLIEQQRNLTFRGLQNSRLVSKTGEIICEQQYSYDELGRLKAFNNYEQNVRSEDWIVEYDLESRLLSARENLTQHKESFRYDGKGNIIYANGHKIEVGSMDQVLRIENDTLDYDKAGNLTRFKDGNNRQLSLTFADNNTLKQVQIGNETWEYWYDSLGRRVGKSNGKEASKFFWSGDKLLTEEYTKDKLVVAREYIYTDSNVPVAFKEGNKIYFLQSDVRGAIVKVHDERGGIVWSASYTAFGKANIAIEKINQPWRLAGQYFDKETALHYNLARYYSPFLRTFLSLDAKWLIYGATNYSYAANDPYNKIDTDGNLPEWIRPGGVGFVAGLVAGAVVGALLLPATATVAVVMAVGAVAGVVGALVDTMVTNQLEGKPICQECLKNALIGGAFGLIAGPLGKILGKGLGAVAKKLTPKIAKTFPRIGKLLGGGARRAATHSSGWKKASLKDAVKKFAPGSKGVKTPKGKVIYRNDKTGVEVVHDEAGDYFRIHDSTKPGKRTYLDLEGNIPNNKTVNGKQMGRSQSEYNQETHYNNSD